RAVRLLPVRPDHVGFCATGKQAKSQRRRHRLRDGRQHLPLWHLPPDSRGHQAGCAVHRHQWTERLNMFPDQLGSSAADCAAEALWERDLTRRRFLTAGAAAGGGLLLSVSLPALTCDAKAADAGTFAPNAFVRIGRDGQVTLIMHKVEMGQGTYTSMPMLLAEELEVDLSQVRLEHAPPSDELYAEPLFGGRETGGAA